jgi:Uma2 family endonuclease
MERVLTLQEMALAADNQKLILQGIGWDFYEEILKEYEDSHALRFAYNDGFLEVEVPTRKHEKLTWLLSKIVELVCEELRIDADNSGSTTFRKRLKAKGVEPDTCFYIQNELKIRGKMELDLATDPPPDLVIEVDITSPSLEKLPIYAGLEVPEVWLYKGERVQFFQLYGDKYCEVKDSIAVPVLSSEAATEFIIKGLKESPVNWARAVREWARDKR